MFRTRTKEQKDKRMGIIRTAARICYYYPIEKTTTIFFLWRFQRFYSCHKNFFFSSLSFYLLNLIIPWTNATGVIGRYQSHYLFLITLSSLCIRDWLHENKKRKKRRKEIKTMVHKTQFFYLFVSRRTEEVYTQTIDIYVYAHTYSI